MSTVFTGSGDARARAFDAESGALQRVFRGHAFIINCIQVGAPARIPGACLHPPAWEGGGKELAPRAPTGGPPRGRGPRTDRPVLGFGSGCAGCPACSGCGRAGSAWLIRNCGTDAGTYWGGRGSRLLPAPPASRPQVHGQVLYTASHDGALRLWDVRGLPRAPPPRSLSRLFSNKVGCAAAPLQPA